jgi:hypothetical protein
MKKLFLVIAILSGVMTHAQNPYISGGFNIGSDYYGNRYVYFQGTNITQYNIPITVVSVNEELNENKKWSFTLIAGGAFSIGPNESWYWQPGEKLFVYFSNGQSIYWTYGVSRKNPSFTGCAGRNCTGDRHSCCCPGYEARSRADWHCKHCTHVKSDHKF